MGLLGSADENLRALERLLAADLHVRGNVVTLSGEPADVALAERGALRTSRDRRQRQPLTPEGVPHSVAMLVGTGNESPAEVLTLDILLVAAEDDSAEAAQSEALRRRDRTHIVLGIGPAGTGKTYLAMAKAVNALRPNRSPASS